jgi:hypothetical protein
MKRLFSFFALPAVIATFALAGCEKKDAKILFEGGETPALTSSTTAPVLDPLKESDVAITFNWTNPNYVFTTGPSSHDVQYTLEIDTVGSNFTNPNKGVVVMSNVLSKTYTTFDLNVLLSGANFMKLQPDRAYNFEARIVSSLRSGSVKKLSNVVKFSAKPYSPPPAVTPPTSGRLFLVGNASPGGWDNPVPGNQEFTKVPNVLHQYEITINLTGGNSMLMLPVNGSWSDKYGWDGANNANNPAGDKLARGGGDIKVPAQTGLYKIVADFQNGRFTITKQ